MTTRWQPHLQELESVLAEKLGDTLPGLSGQTAMAPRPRRGWKPGRRPEDARNGAALLLLFPSPAGPRILLTVRTEELPTHKGQVSLPGGRVEPGETMIETALREAHEETDVDPAGVRVLGELTPLLIPVSGFLLHPVVGIADARPAFRPHPGEVDRIVEPLVADLSDPANHGLQKRDLPDFLQQVPYFDVEGVRVWGATAMVLAEFLSVLGRSPQPPAGDSIRKTS